MVESAKRVDMEERHAPTRAFIFKKCVMSRWLRADDAVITITRHVPVHVMSFDFARHAAIFRRRHDRSRQSDPSFFTITPDTYRRSKAMIFSAAIIADPAPRPDAEP